MSRPFTSIGARRALSFLILVTVLISSAALAAPPPMPAAPGSSNMQPTPPAAMVLQQMHMVNQFEIKAAELAEKKGTTTRIRRYADRLRRDHENADGKVEYLARRLGYTLHSPEQMRQMMMQKEHRSSPMGSSGMAPGGSTLTPMQQKMQAMMQMMQQAMAHLQSASGPQFDHAYLMTMVKSHQKAIGMLEQVQAKGLDQPQVTGLIHKLLPILKQHLQLAQGLQKRMAG